jgi:hypothetical protein
MSIINPDSPRHNPKRPAGKPVLKIDIEEAQRNTNSNKGAARYLGLEYRTYKKYAQLYGLFDRHLNVKGIGVDKGFSKNPNSVPLKEIFNNQHPNYSPAKLKNRLLARKILPNQCNLCGFNEKRITDQKVPLILTFIDGNNKNFTKDNLQVLCYNCMFLTTGAPRVAHHRHIEKSYDYHTNTQNEHKHKIPLQSILEPTEADRYDKDDKILTGNNDIILTEEEKRAILDEL